MGKKIIITLITFYQNFLSYFLKALVGYDRFCRYEVTCSDYARNSVMKHGVLKGTWMGIKRLLTCQPFYKNKEAFS